MVRQKNGYVFLSNGTSPPSDSSGMCAALNSGVVALSSPLLASTTATRSGVVPSSFCAAGTASAGSPRSSTIWQRSWRPNSPPARLIRFTAGTQPACSVNP